MHDVKKRNATAKTLKTDTQTTRKNKHFYKVANNW